MDKLGALKKEEEDRLARLAKKDNALAKLAELLPPLMARSGLTLTPTLTLTLNLTLTLTLTLTLSKWATPTATGSAASMRSRGGARAAAPRTSS